MGASNCASGCLVLVLGLDRLVLLAFENCQGGKGREREEEEEEGC